MEISWTPPNLILWAIPAFIILLLLEVGVAAHEKRDWFVKKDTFSSLSMGIGNVVTGFVSKLFVAAGYWFTFQFRLFELPVEGAILGGYGLMWFCLFFCEDFSYYWFHRSSHQIRWFWASHVVHHSSEKYNLGTALRQTWTGNFTGGFVFWMWLPLIGFHPQYVMMMQSISLLYQFWIHTEWIDKMWKPIEFIFNTPSHHRVHHGSDLKYLDKNHAGVLIIWDRMFGTFQVEQERPTYGLTTNLTTFNPVKIAFHEWRDIFSDLKNATSLKNAWHYLFGAPGWSHDGSRKTTEQLREENK